MLKLRHPTGLKPVLGTFAICKAGQNHAKPGGLTQPTLKQPVPKPKPNTQESSTSQPTKPKQSQTQRTGYPKHPSHPTGLRQVLGTFAEPGKAIQNREVQHNQLPDNQPPNPSQTHKKAPNKAPRSSQIVVMGPPPPCKPLSNPVVVMGGPPPRNLGCACGCMVQRHLLDQVKFGLWGALPPATWSVSVGVCCKGPCGSSCVVVMGELPPAT